VAYALTQCQAIVRYLSLAVWPRGLVFDYGKDVVKDFAAVWPQACIVLVLLGQPRTRCFASPSWICGCWFFGILAPSSSVIPLTTQTMAEHRMYLPLIAVIAIAQSDSSPRRTRRLGLQLLRSWQRCSAGAPCGAMSLPKRDQPVERHHCQTSAECPGL